MSSSGNFNQRIIEAFHSNSGTVDGSDPLLLLTTTGARSGHPRTTPVAYSTDGDHLAIVASNGGAPTNPGWYHNVLVNPIVTVGVSASDFKPVLLSQKSQNANDRLPNTPR